MTTGATAATTGATPQQLSAAKDALIRRRCGLQTKDSIQGSNVPLWQINKADDQVDAVAPHLVPPTHRIVERTDVGLAKRLMDRFDPDTVEAILAEVERDHAIVPHDRVMDPDDKAAIGFAKTVVQDTIDLSNAGDESASESLQEALHSFPADSREGHLARLQRLAGMP